MKKVYTLTLALLLSIVASYAQYYYVPKNGKNPGGLNNDKEYPANGGGLDASWAIAYTCQSKTSVWSDAINIPFSFGFNGNNYSSVKVSTNGVLTFTASPSGLPVDANAALPHSSIPDNSIMIWGILPLMDATYPGYITTKTFGTAPNRQFWVQFNTFSDPSQGSGGWFFGSIVLEETTNNFYIVDQRSYPNTTTLTLGVQLNSSTAYMVEGSPNYATKSQTDATPSDNYYYEFHQGNQPANDASFVSVNTAKNLSAKNSPFDISCTIFNAGSAPINSVKFTYQIDQSTPVSAVVNGLNIAKFAKGNITSTIKWAQTDVTVSTLKITIDEVNGQADANPADNSGTKAVNVWEDCVLRKTLFEGFTSSTCGPCVLGNTTLHKVLDARPGKYTVVKYQMHFPSTGDPYVTAEGKARASFYGNTALTVGIPRGYVDGKWDANTQGLTTDIFDSYNENASFLKIATSQTRTDNKFDFNIDVTPVSTIASSQYKMFFAVVERTTVNNVATNGETEFHWVMKKMLPDNNGTTFTMPAKNVTSNQKFTWTVPGSYRLPQDGQAANMINLATENSVEELWDLVGVVWIQNINTKEVLQSEWTLPVGATLGNKELKVENMGMSIFPNPTSGSFTVKLDKSAENLQVTITNLAGQTVMAKEFGKGLEKEFDCSSLNNGIYMVTISNGETKTTQKLIINR